MTGESLMLKQHATLNECGEFFSLSLHSQKVSLIFTKQVGGGSFLVPFPPTLGFGVPPTFDFRVPPYLKKN